MPHVSKMPFLFMSVVFVLVFVFWMLVSWYSYKEEMFFLQKSEKSFSIVWFFN